MVSLDGLSESYAWLLMANFPWLAEPSCLSASCEHRYLDYLEVYSGKDHLSSAVQRATRTVSRMRSVVMCSKYVLGHISLYSEMLMEQLRLGCWWPISISRVTDTKMCLRKVAKLPVTRCVFSIASSFCWDCRILLYFMLGSAVRS